MKRVMNRKKLSLAVGAALALGGATVAQAGIGFKAGDWDIDFSGNVNGFATWNSCDSTSNIVVGGLACNKGTTSTPATACNSGGTNVTSIQSGLLPSALVFSAKSRQMNMDVGVTIGLYPTIRTNPGVLSGNTALGNAAINVRQNYLFFGDKSWGQVKVGRDIGLYASDAILSDMTLLGVGTGAAFLGGPTTLGRIGVGYIYTDWIPQITYTSPDFSGFKVAVGMFQGLDAADGCAVNCNTGLVFTMPQHTQPGWQGKGTYNFKAGEASGEVWASFMVNNVKAPTVVSTTGTVLLSGNPGIYGNAFDIGVKGGLAGFEALLYYYDGSGVGSTLIGANAFHIDTTGGIAKRRSDGWWGQLTYKWQQVKFGYSYGESRLNLASNENSGPTNDGNLLKYNQSNVIGVYYALTQSLNLVGEWIGTKAQNQAGGSNKDSAFALGAILFF